MKPRILIFSTAYLPLVGGAEIAVKEVTDRLSSDYEFDLICARLRADLPRRERLGAVEIYRIGFGVPLLDKLLVPFWGAAQAIALDRAHRYALWWGIMATFGPGAAYVANLLRTHRRVPIVLTLQEGDSPAHISRRRIGLVGLAWRLALSRTHTVTVISAYLAVMTRRYGYRGTPIIVPNGVDTAHFSQEYPPAVLDVARDELGRSMGDVLLVTTSRLVHKNAVDVCIRALPLLPEHVRFVVFGIGPDETALKVLAQRLGVSMRVDFRGLASHAELPKYLKASDIFIRPSRSEGMGNSFLEAMAAGLPVIATQEGGIADFLFDEKRNPDAMVTGWAVDKDSPEQIAAAVRDIMEHPEKVRAVVRTAREMVIERYDWDIVAREMHEKVFRPLVERRA